MALLRAANNGVKPLLPLECMSQRGFAASFQRSPSAISFRFVTNPHAWSSWMSFQRAGSSGGSSPASQPIFFYTCRAMGMHPRFASLITESWNRLVEWLKPVETLRECVAELPGIPAKAGNRYAFLHPSVVRNLSARSFCAELDWDW